MKAIVTSILIFTFGTLLNGCNHRESWQNNTRMIGDAYQECEKQTFKQFRQDPSDLLMSFIGYVQQDLKFQNPSSTQDKVLKRYCQ